MKRYLLLVVLTCLLGSNALAQSNTWTTTIEVKETIDFTGLPTSGDSPNAQIQWDENNSNVIQGINDSNGERMRSFTNYPISVAHGGNTNYWHLWRGSHGQTYLQKHNSDNDTFSIGNLQKGDEVTIWGDNGNQTNGGFQVTSNNNDRYNPNSTIKFEDANTGQVIKMNGDGPLTLNFTGQYSGVLKIEIKREIDQNNRFDYDPGYEEYDMYDEFSWVKNNNPATTYNFNNGSAGFQLNGADAKYITFAGSKITANNRIALTGNANAWTFDFGLVPPGTNGDYSYFSICNLREGDRVVISYINESEDPLIFASGYKDGEYYYDGCAAFKDDNRNGVLNDGEEYVNNGYVAPVDWHRGEGNVGNSDRGRGSGYAPELNYINSYVITQDGHLDLAFKRFVENDDASGDHQDPNKTVSRIVKIKIYSDHQAMMVDEYDANSYWAKFNITGELQAKEHIMPGGLEIQVGNDDATQHALVVSSKYGPVSYVNAVDGFKIPGVSKNGDQISINFDLGINGDVTKLPTTGTFYKFIPEVNGKMKFKFDAKSMNYYRWDMKGSSVYQNTDLQNSDGGYGTWGQLFDRPNEQTVDANCPYYLVKVVNGQIANIQSLGNIYNGGEYETPNYIDVEVGEEYYLFGGWNQTDLYYNSSWTVPGNPDYNSDASNKQYNNIEFRPMDNRTVGCGIAQLLWVEFDPDKKIYPLAKWVPNGTIGVCDEGPGENKQKHGVPNPDVISYDEDKLEYELADLYGYNDKTSLTVKKMAGNITGCTPFLKLVPGGQGQHFKLMIKDITFAQNKDKGGTILIKIDDATVKTNPVYTLTIAYSGNPTFDGNSGSGTRGHIWDYSSNSLHGLKYDASVVSQTGDQGGKKIYTPNAAVPEDYGHYFQNYFAADISGYSSADAVFTGLAQSASGKLHDEINSGTSEWMFNYNLVNDGKLYDPVFSNKYDLEADNADLIWDTEGTVIRTSANSSVMFNEFTGEDVHQSTVDPERYVGILKGGEFRIPWLMPNDRVIIWMGTGKGAFNDHAVFNIRGAYDALHKEIAESDDYIVGGSQWNGDEKDYKGCYHFFAQGDGNGGPADMVFKMTTGSMCKIYKIQIYRGDRINTNEIVGTNEANNKFLLSNTAPDPNDGNPNATTVQGDTYDWTLQYFGKEQKLADGTGKNSQENEIIAQTGNITESITTDAVANTFTYKHATDEIGTFRMRGKDMEKNMNYVADYADHNVTIALQETQMYPYTWDFTDMTGFGNVENLFSPEEQLGEVQPEGLTEDVWNSLANTSYQKTARDLSLWEVSSTEGFYFLRLNTEVVTTGTSNPRDNIFETAQEINGNQVWANGQVVPETQGLWFYTANNTQRTPKWLISANGMDFYGTNHTLVVPNVPAGAAVYLRMAAIPEEATSCTYQFQEKVGLNFENVSTSAFKVYNLTKVENTLSEDATSDEYIVAFKNISSSKKYLILSIGGYELKKLSVSTDPKSVNIKGYASESRDHAIDASLLPYFTDKPMKSYLVSSPDYTKHTITLTDVSESPAPVVPAESGYVIYNPDNANDTGEFNLFGDNKGFHLFVPDMHDDEESEGKFASVTTNNEFMIPVLEERSGDNKLKSFSADGSKTNYVLSYKWYDLKPDGSTTGTQHVGDEMFYRVSREGINLRANSAYLVLDTDKVGLNTSQGSIQGSTNSAKFTFVFTDWNDMPSIPTAIEEANSVETFDPRNGEWYNMNGQKLNGIPATKGLYIMNGKKVLVK